MKVFHTAMCAALDTHMGPFSSDGKCMPCRNIRVCNANADPEAVLLRKKAREKEAPKKKAAKRKLNARRMRLKRIGHEEELNAISRARRHADGRRGMLYDAKKRAKRRGEPFDLSLEDIVVPSSCPWLGLPLIWGRGKPTWNSPSLDQLVIGRGYVKGNVLVVSRKANLIKSFSTLEELQAVTDGVRRSLGE